MKAKERKKKIRDLLLQLKKTSWTDIQTKTKIQSKELSYDLKDLLNNREITAEKDTKDRRKTWYRLVDKDKTKAESSRYEVIEFIESLKEPFSIELEAKEGPYKTYQSWFMELPDEYIKDRVKKTTNQQITKKQIDQGKAEIKAEMEKKFSEILKIIPKYMEIQDILSPTFPHRFVTVSAYEYGGHGKEKYNENEEGVKP